MIAIVLKSIMKQLHGRSLVNDKYCIMCAASQFFVDEKQGKSSQPWACKSIKTSIKA
jgi:hypothetical protein